SALPRGSAVTAETSSPGGAKASTQADVPTGSQSLSQMQRAMWFIQRMAPESAAYNVAFSAKIEGAVDAVSMRRAVQIVVGRHNALRTTYLARGGEPFLRIDSTASHFEQIDANGWDADRLLAGVQERA